MLFRSVYIQRGYENFEEKLRGLGAVIERIPVDDDTAVRKFQFKVS